MPRLLGRKHTAIKDIKVTAATHGFLIFAPVQCIVEKQIDRERIGFLGSSRTISVPSDVTTERVEECMSPISPLVQQKNEGGYIYFVIRTSKLKCSGSSCHFGRGFLNGKSLRIVGGEGTLRKLIYSLTEGPHAHRAFLVFRSNPWKAAAVIVSTIPCMRFLRPITGVQHGSDEDSHSDWSSLPLLLLWMIMDRLDFFNNAKVGLVCRHWWYGCRNNPTKMQTVGDGIPWIMLNPSEVGNTKTCVREFINYENSKKFVVELPEFHMSYPLFSRRGWILLSRINLCKEDQMVDSLFLINPLTKGKIQVGDIVIDCEGGLSRHYMQRQDRRPLYTGCFSTNQDDGFPNCVVICYKHFQVNKISLYITYLGGGGDQVWTKQSYVVKGSMFRNCGMAVINSHVYMFCDGGGLISYDMGGQTWKEIEFPLGRSIARLFGYMEHEGHVGLFGYYDNERWLLKYNHNHPGNCWQKLANDDEANIGLSIFGSHYYPYCTVRMQSGLNVHSINANARVSTNNFLLGKEIGSFKLRGRGPIWVYIG